LDLNSRRILIVRTDRIGDVILTLPMARALKKHSPSVRVAFLIQRYTSEIVEGDPDVDRAIYLDQGGRNVSFFRLASALRSERFDMVFHTHPMFRLALVTRLAGIPLRVGTGYRWYSFLFNRKVYEHRKDARKHELEYNLRLLEEVGCPVDYGAVAPSLEVRPETLDSVRTLLGGLGLSPAERIVIIHPGSGGSARDWSPKSFGLLARRLALLPDVRVLVTGTGNEERIVREVVDLSGGRALPVVDLLNVREYTALAKLAALFIANSTGPLHIAAAAGTTVIGLYPQVTPLSATRWGPYTERKTIFSPAGKPADCARCVSSKSASCECMDSITVEEVYRSARSYLSAD
jgi:ADP-heptose:LPS heptosyltransferase